MRMQRGFRSFLGLLACLAFAGAATAQDKAPKAKLGIGDAAPAWNVKHWLNGKEIKEYEAGKVYIVEFWATWCGPCIAAMPHLAELQEEYKDKGLVIIGMTTKDEANTLEKVTKFVDARGPKLGYVFAFCDGEETHKAYMDAAGQEGIPCSFVVDKKGKIAYIGHPALLDDVLPKVIEGTWKGKEDLEAIDKMNAELEKILDPKSVELAPGSVLDKLDAFGKTYPEKFAQDMLQGQRMSLMVMNGKFDDAKKIAEALIAKSEKKKSAMPGLYVAIAFAEKKANPDLKHADLIEKSLEHALKIEPTDVSLALEAVRIYTLLDKKDKAKEAGEAAVKNAPNDEARKQIAKIVKDLSSGSK